VGGWVGVLKVLGYGWAGLMRRFLVDPAHMWWPGNLVQVTIFRQVSQVFYFFSVPKKKVIKLQIIFICKKDHAKNYRK
jgi:hypothetical protein